MTYSYTQISQYLSCPRRYRHRYLDGWQEKDTRAAMLFGRAFEQAVAALFRREDPAAVLFDQWSVCKDIGLTYSGNDTWDRMLQQGIQLLERFTQDGRVRIRHPRSTQQIQVNQTLGSGNDFVSYVDAIGELDGTRCVLEWKTTSARYPEEPVGISALDPQLVCYSWMTGIDEVAQIVFVLEAGHTQRPEIEAAVRLLSGCEHISFLLNKAAASSDHFGSYPYYGSPDDASKVAID